MLDTKNPLATIIVGSGFLVTVNSGTIILAGIPTTIPQTIINLTPNAANFIHITGGGVLTVNTSGFPSDCLPVSKVVCSPTAITGITDSRPDFIIPSSGGSSLTSVFQPWGALMSAGGLSATPLTGANTIKLTGFYLSNAISFTNILVRVVTGDIVNYDWGVYDSSGSLKAHVGPVNPSTGVMDLSVLGGGSVSLSSGKYYFAFTGLGSTATLAAPGSLAFSFTTFLGPTDSATASTSGTLPNSIAIPSDSWADVASVYTFALHA